MLSGYDLACLGTQHLKGEGGLRVQGQTGFISSFLKRGRCALWHEWLWNYQWNLQHFKRDFPANATSKSRLLPSHGSHHRKLRPGSPNSFTVTCCCNIVDCVSLDTGLVPLDWCLTFYNELRLSWKYHIIMRFDTNWRLEKLLLPWVTFQYTHIGKSDTCYIVTQIFFLLFLCIWLFGGVVSR